MGPSVSMVLFHHRKHVPIIELPIVPEALLCDPSVHLCFECAACQMLVIPFVRYRKWQQPSTMLRHPIFPHFPPFPSIFPIFPTFPWPGGDLVTPGAGDFKGLHVVTCCHMLSHVPVDEQQAINRAKLRAVCHVVRVATTPRTTTATDS